jgi:alginate O-acetyltransferase complex protein AlgI
MLFCSYLFLFYFLPIVLAVYLVVPAVLKNVVLVVASLIFYAWGEPQFVGMLLCLCAVDFIISQLIERATPRWSKVWLCLSISSSVISLGYFKYANFFVEEASRVSSWFGAPPLAWQTIVLPVGISFFTFHKISYVVDVYRKVRPPCRNPITFLLYILFFPQLVAGPIIRYHDIEDQLVNRTTRINDIYDGLVRFSIGLSKKVLIADVVGHTADQVFALKPSLLTPELAWLGISAYTAQIYFDFSGYSDMAIGLGRMFGFRFPENFNQPYLASSFTDFWRRWHMSFGRWVREYLYYPLGGNKGGVVRQYVNLWIVFLFSGLWHGAQWTFILWGVWHGFFMTIERLFLAKYLVRIPQAAQVLLTLFLVMLSRVLFRADNLSHAAKYFEHLISSAAVKKKLPIYSVTSNFELVMILVAYTLCLWPLIPGALGIKERIRSRSSQTIRVAATALQAALLLLLSVAVMASTDFSPFIYFQF